MRHFVSAPPPHTNLLRNSLHPEEGASVRIVHCRQNDYSTREEGKNSQRKELFFFSNNNMR